MSLVSGKDLGTFFWRSSLNGMMFQVLKDRITALEHCYIHSWDAWWAFKLSTLQRLNFKNAEIGLKSDHSKVWNPKKFWSKARSKWIFALIKKFIPRTKQYGSGTLFFTMAQGWFWIRRLLSSCKFNCNLGTSCSSPTPLTVNKIIEPLTMIFNQSLRTRVIQDDVKLTNVTPIFKKATNLTL